MSALFVPLNPSKIWGGRRESISGLEEKKLIKCTSQISGMSAAGADLRRLPPY